MATTFMAELNGETCLPHEKRADFYHKMKLAVYVIKVRCDARGQTYGAGMGISGEGLVLTSAQVIGKKPSEISLRSYDGTEFAMAEVLHKDRTRDLVLLRKCQMATTKIGAEPADIFHYVELCAAESIKVGMQVYCISHPWHFSYSLTIGEIAHPAGTDDDPDPTRTCVERSVNRRRIKDCRFLSNSTKLLWKDLRSDLHVIQVNNIHGGDGSNGSPVFNASGQVIGMWSLRYEGFDFCIHVDTIRNFLLQWEKGDSKGGPSRLARTSPKRVRHSYKGQAKGGSLSTGQRTCENVRLNVVGQNEQLMHKKGENETGGSFFARQYSEDILPAFSAFSLSDDCSTLEDRRTGTTVMLDDNAKCVDGSHLPSELNRITKSNTYTKITMQKENKPERYSERKGEVPERTVSKLSKSGLTKKNALSSSSLKRKTLEELKIDTKSSNSSKSVMESIIGRRAISQNLDVSPTAHKKTVFGTENPGSFSHSNHVPKMKNEADLVHDLPKENAENSESCAKELDDVWNMLKKVEAAAKELLASCVMKNSATMVLNHPMYSEKIRALESFVRKQVTELEYQSGD